MTSIVTVIVAVSGVFSGARAARAAEPRDVEALIGAGMDLRRQGKDERALPFFQKAYGIEHTPRTAGQLGLCEMAVGYWLSSEAHLAEALDSPGHPWIAKNQSTLASALERVRKRIGEVTVTGSPVGARVVLNGQDVGTLPLAAPVRVGEGRVQVELSAAGYVTSSQTLHLAGGDKERVTMALIAESGMASITPAPVAAAAAPSSSVAPAPIADAKETPLGGAAAQPAGEIAAATPEGRSSPTAAYVTGGVAVVSLIFAIAETVQWKSKESEFASHVGASTLTAPLQVHCGESDPGRGAAGCQKIYDDGVRAWKLSLVGYGLTGVLGATALYLFLTADRGEGAVAHAQRRELRCLPSVGLAGIASAGLDCGLRF